VRSYCILDVYSSAPTANCSVVLFLIVFHSEPAERLADASREKETRTASLVKKDIANLTKVNFQTRKEG